MEWSARRRAQRLACDHCPGVGFVQKHAQATALPPYLFRVILDDLAGFGAGLEVVRADLAR